MAKLVLYYTHAAIEPPFSYPSLDASVATADSLSTATDPGSLYAVSSSGGSFFSTSTRAHWCTVPSFPAHLFQPHEGFFRTGSLLRRVKLSPLDQLSRHPFSARFFGEWGFNRHDGDINITPGQLVSWFLAIPAVAKTAHGPHASRRLLREFEVYKHLHALQGCAIPNLVGLYTNQSDGSPVLIISHAGKPLETFAALSLDNRFYCTVFNCDRSDHSP
ncbi:hypothetical protein K438DRAFT_523940 [Mycena galopus ATCC 62051]|nr:hypothetical protein K438DRAFT_523940 [Mycena galopus ATCC 62051]